MSEGLDEGVLHRFFCVLDVSENSEGHAKNATLMPSNERLEGPPVASQNAFDQNEVALRTFTFRDLGWFDHIGGHRPMPYQSRFMGLPIRGKRFKPCARRPRSTLID